MDRYRFTTLAHANLDLLGPIDARSRDALLREIELAPTLNGRPTLLDVGCGKGGWLLPAMKRFGGKGIGIEPNPSFAATLRTQASLWGVACDIQIEMCHADRVNLMGGTIDAAFCVGSTHAYGGYAATLKQLARVLVPRGWAVIGEGFWRRKPDPDYLAFFGEDESMMLPLEETFALARDAGWRIARHHESSQNEFDTYERTYAANMHFAIQARPDDPDTEAFHARITAHADAYERWGRDTFGFVTMVLQH